jgi:hypothetical protein
MREKACGDVCDSQCHGSGAMHVEPALLIRLDGMAGDEANHSVGNYHKGKANTAEPHRDPAPDGSRGQACPVNTRFAHLFAGLISPCH